MFTPKKIEGALTRLFNLFDAEVMEGLYENYGEEIEDISLKLLAKACRKNATTVYEYRTVCRVSEDFDFNGRTLFKHRGVNLLSYQEAVMENGRLLLMTCTELWLLEDMTFAVVQYVGTLVKNGREADCITEYRRFVKKIKTEADVFFSPEDLICALDDICMYAQIFK